ncbi:sensor domain-containing protein [Paenibacillus sp. CMAA1364]
METLYIIFIILVSFIGMLVYYVEQVKRTRNRLAQINDDFILATKSSGVVVWHFDLMSHEYYFSDHWYEILGYDKDELNESRGGWMDILHPDNIEAEHVYRTLCLEGMTQNYDSKYRLKTKIGDYKWFRVRGTVVRDPNSMNSRLVGSMIDVSEQMDTEHKLIESQRDITKNIERYLLITNATNDGIWDIDYRNNEYYYSQRWHELLLINAEECDNNKIKTDHIHPDDIEVYMDAVKEHQISKSDFYQCEVRLLLSDGTYKCFLLRGKVLWDDNGEIYRMTGSISDIELLKQSQKKMVELVYKDALTALPNRLSLSDVFRTYMDQNKNGKAALFFLNIDNFKAINDTMGYAFGDQVLIEVGKRLSSITDGNASHYRFGGDEFVILLTNIQMDQDIIHYAECCMEQFNLGFLIGDSKVHISLSMGVAQYPEHGLNEDELLKNADVAMYKAKEIRKGKYVIYNQQIQDSFNHRIVIEKHLRMAIDNEELSLYYQPQLDIRTGEIWGFEALLRWNSSVLGFVSPLTFINIAEDCRLIIPIGQWVLRTACYAMKNLHNQGYEGYRVSVNISVVQLLQEDFTDMVLNILDETGLSPQYLEIEITESRIMESFDKNNAQLAYLRAKGIAIALDDFGTGYSSLSYLKQLPITTLKIDKLFIDGVPDHKRDVSITNAIIAIGHEMGLEIVGEGVETEDQRSVLKQLGCDRIQGYLISKPIPVQDVPQWIEHQVK